MTVAENCLLVECCASYCNCSIVRLPAISLKSLKRLWKRSVLTLNRCQNKMICVELGVDESPNIDLSVFISDLNLNLEQH